MTILTRERILEEIEEGRVEIDPLEEDQVGPASIDLTLDDQFRIYNEVQDVLDVTEEADMEDITRMKTVEDSILLKPGQSMHGITEERVSLPDDICGWIEGRSRFARLGLLVHVTAGFMQPGIDNQQVLEIANVSPVPLRLHPGTRVCQIVLERTEGSARYRGRYHEQASP